MLIAKRLSAEAYLARSSMPAAPSAPGGVARGYRREVGDARDDFWSTSRAMRRREAAPSFL